MSTTHNRPTRGAFRPSITEQDIQAQLRTDPDNDNSMMGPNTQSLMVSSSESSHNDDPTDLSYSLPIWPLSSIQVIDIDSELALTRNESEELCNVMRSSMHKRGVLGSLDFRNRIATEDALKPVLKDVKIELPWLDAKAKRKGGSGASRLVELLSGRARLVEVGERRKMRKGNKDGTELQDQDQDHDAEAHQVDKDVADRADAHAATALNGLSVQEAPGAYAVPTQRPASRLAHASTTPTFCPTSFIVRVAGSTNGAAILTTQLTIDAHSGPPTVDDLMLDRFLQVVSDQVGFKVEGRISAVLPKFYAVAPINSRIDVGSEGQWMAVLKAWQTMRRKTCEFVVEAGEADAETRK
ncbi:hypothetical protein IQ06DRAFT_56222 [Phaeosphaeriaceae sp. SRC1lsM3a]|nr:hypothetical protein IQ06DRAFT_56222 [Stagonospora sp. SRC1lsM3a]